MSVRIDLESFDTNGDVRESAEAAGIDRSRFLKTGAAAGTGAAALFGLPTMADARISSKRKSAKNDVKIMNFALTLEIMGHHVYAAAVTQDRFATPELRQFANVVVGHEAGHVRTLTRALGRKAGRKPTFNDDAVQAAIAPDVFPVTATMLEDTDTSAFAGQGPNVRSRKLVAMSLAFHSVEARHASWIRALRGGIEPGANPQLFPAPATYDTARTQGQVLRVVGKADFLKTYDKTVI